MCIGNVCRSPMAESLFKREFEADAQMSIESAGLGAPVGRPASDHSRQLMSEIGVDISEHRARQIHPLMVDAADLVLVMDKRQKRSIVDADPVARGKVFRLGKWQDIDIDDPYQKPIEDYRKALMRIQAGVASWTEKIRA